MDDPELIALRERALAEIENAIESAARDDLAAARQRYEHAVCTARTAGFSWTEIGRILGVSRQQVHRQFRARPAN